MGLFSKKNSAPTGKKAYEQGYVSFNAEDLKQKSQEEAARANQQAYALLDQAMSTSSHIKEKDAKGKEADIDDVYPVSLEEANEMDRLLDEAEAAIVNHNDQEIKECISEIRGIVGWSKVRHWDFSWKVLAGAVVSLFFMFYWSADASNEARKAEAVVEGVEEWEKMDTTIAWEKFYFLKEKAVDHSLAMQSHSNRLKNANLYKADALLSHANDHYSSLRSAEKYRAQADTASTKDRKKYYLKEAKEADERAEEAREEYDDVNDMKFKKIRKLALEDVEADADAAASGRLFFNLLLAFFVLCTPLYIFAARPYGYMKTRHRTEAKVLGGIAKIGYAISAFLAGSAFMIQDEPDTKVTTHWSDGSRTTHTESNPINMVYWAIRIGLLFAALVILCVVSCFVMAYSTITGLMRNYDWTPVKMKLNEWFGKAKVVAEAKINEVKEKRNTPSNEA